MGSPLLLLELCNFWYVFHVVVQSFVSLYDIHTKPTTLVEDLIALVHCLTKVNHRKSLSESSCQISAESQDTEPDKWYKKLSLHTPKFKTSYQYLPLAGVPFPRNFQSNAKTILKRLFRVYAHIYHQHFSEVVQLGEEAHLNTSFKHFIFFVQVSALRFLERWLYWFFFFISYICWCKGIRHCHLSLFNLS